MGVIKELRLLGRMTQRELAEKAGLSPTGLLLIEQGKRQPRGRTIDRLAKALEVDARELAGRLVAERREAGK